jgi:hypothetical protein
MRRIIGLALTLAVVSAWSVRSQSERSVWEGVYTGEQSTRGETAFSGFCARCHTAEDFSGDTFLLSWENTTALDLFGILQKTMPQDNPGSLRPEDYADIVAYFFSLNKFPAGTSELDTNAERLKLIRIQSKK